jgi:3-oxoacyl-[acyl-carrier protein] reductase
MDLGLNGKVALITGGSRGIGLRTARVLAAEGCHLGLCARNEEDLTAAAGELRESGAQVVAVAGDIIDLSNATRFVDRCAAKLGRIDILVNNVGGSVGGRSIMEVTDDEWLQTFDRNFHQAVRMTRLVVPHMREQGGGAIVNIASISGWLPQLAGSPQYGASKAALIFLTERAALELVHDSIRVNTVSPGSIYFQGGGWERWKQSVPESYAEYIRNGFPMGRLGTPEEVADVVAFLVSPRANWINGRHIPVDGLEQPVSMRELQPW